MVLGEIDFPDIIDGTEFLERSTIQIVQERRHVNTDIDLVGCEGAIRGELQHRFLEVEIPAISDSSSYTVAFLVQDSGVELFAFTHFAALFVHRHFAHVLQRDVHFVMTDLIGLMGGDEISEFDLTFLDHFLGVHFGMEIAHVVHLLAELLHADAGEVFVIDNRRLAHLMGIACEPFVGLGSRVPRGGVIDLKLQLPETKDLSVLLLTEIIAKGSGRDFFVIRTFDIGFVQEILTLRHEFGRAAGGYQHDSQEQKDICTDALFHDSSLLNSARTIAVAIETFRLSEVSASLG